MKLKLKNTPEQIELVRAMGSKNMVEAREAQEAFAAFLGPVVQQVLNQAGLANAIYVDAPFDEDDSPSYPLDLYYGNSQNHVSIWQQGIAGGLPSSHVEGMSELKIATYRLDSAVNMLRKYARRARLDVISKGVERMSQEILVKQERNAWAVVLKALSEATTGGNAHIIDSTASSGAIFQLDDMNKLMTRIRRINESFANGTPDTAYSTGLTDMYMSPEMVEQVRGFAYQPMNTRAANISSADENGIALPDGVREDIFRSAGAQEIYGVTINEINELGSGKKYVTLYNSFGTDVGTDLIIGLDNSKGAFVRPVAQQHESGGSFTTLADDQWSSRSEKLGFYGFLEEGRVCIDSRAVVGINVR